MNKKIILCVWAFILFASVGAQTVDWPEVTVESKPAARWWWMGSAVDKPNLTSNLEAYAKAGMGTMEITPIYGVQGNDANEIPFLSARWMEMLRHTESEAARLGMKIDMNTGTGWPFGGPEVTIADAASKLLTRRYHLKGGESLKEKIEVADVAQRPYARLDRLMAYNLTSKPRRCIDLTGKVKDGELQWTAPEGDWLLIGAFCGKTLQKVKRAAPGGEGYVMNHLSAPAVKKYLHRFEQAFAATRTPYPHNFFNDSYEVYKADWAENLFDEFAARRGYKLENYLPEFLSDERTDTTARIISDYRETVSELLQENFTRQWTEWAHTHGTRTRNQAHGSPGNLIDLYATVDVPECEGFGLSDFHIRGLRKDSLTRPNDSDLSMLKYASSAAHIAGKPFTSAETFTWLTEHFRTSLSQCKPDIDLMFVSGVNHTYFHGTAYSPAEAVWPGWKFYASVDMSPTNSIWRDAPAFFSYIARCQSFLQMGKPDNDFLLYLPVYDMWQKQDGRLLLFDIHKMAKRAPQFIDAVHRMINAGYDLDYISDQFIRTTTCVDGKLVTSGGTSYKALVVPGARLMPEGVLAHLFRLADEGATIVFLDQYPVDVPGFARLDERRASFRKLMKQKDKPRKGRILFGTDYVRTLAETGVYPETMKTKDKLSCIRRSNEDGFHYFISALKSGDTDGWVTLGVQAASAVFYNPMNGESGKACIRRKDGQTQVYLQLASGESVILKTFTNTDVDVPAWKYWRPKVSWTIPGKWGFRFVESTPQVTSAPDSVSLGSWTELPVPEAKNTMGTACYSTTFHLHDTSIPEWMLDLGDVRESARVRINGQEVATLWAVPYRCPVGKYLRPGANILEVEVTGLPANRIADMDRRQVPWRIFKEINMVDRNYKKTGYAGWACMPNGLLGPVKMIPMRELTVSQPHPLNPPLQGARGK